MEYKLVEAPKKPKNPNAKGHGDNRVRMMVVDENGNRVQITKDNFDRLLELFRPDVKPIGEFQRSYYPMEFLCLKHNDKFTTTPDRIIKFGVGCKNCIREKTYPDKVIYKDEFLKILEENCPTIEKVEFPDDYVVQLTANIVILTNNDTRTKKMSINTALKDPSSIFKPVKRIRKMPKIYDNEGNIVTKLNKDLFYELVAVQRPDIILLTKYISANGKILCYCRIHNRTFETSPSRLLNGKVGCEECTTLKMKKANFNVTAEEWIKKYNEKFPDIEVVKIHDDLFNQRSKVTLRCKIHPDNEWTIAMKQALHGNGCSICNEEKEVMESGNNIYTVRPDLIKYFENPEDAKKYTPFSGKKVELVCPNCGYKKEILISNLNKCGFGCDVCGDGISYLNKFLRNLMLRLNAGCLEFEKLEYNKEGKKRYFDCYFEFKGEKYVVEVDGSFHTKETSFRTLKNNQMVDKEKDEIAEEKGWIMIRIPCPKDSRQEIEEGIKNSIISQLFDLSQINWDEIDGLAQKSLVKEVCDYFENNPGVTYKQLKERFNISSSAILSYLKRGRKIGWVTKQSINKGKITSFDAVHRTRPVTCYDKNGNKIGDFPTTISCTKYLREVIGLDIRNGYITGVLTGHQKNKTDYIFEDYKGE